MTTATEPLVYDPYAYEIHEDPYPTYRRMRDEAPLYRNEERGFWERNDQNAENDPEDPMSARKRRVIPYVEDHRNALLLHLDPSIGADQRMAAMYALKLMHM